MSPTKHSPNPGPVASRPYIQDPTYGIPKSKQGLLPWSHVSGRMTEAKVYWVSTVDPDGHPHATPVDGFWLDERLYFSGSPQTRRNRNLVANPAACIHLESGSDVVILQGETIQLRPVSQETAVRLANASAEKYGYPTPPEFYQSVEVFEFRPRVVFAWKQFPKDVTRWHVPENE
jgi:hypothetical protein